MKTINTKQLSLSLFERMRANNIIMNYYGALSFDMAQHLIDDIYDSLNNTSLDSVIVKKIYSTFIEGVENIVKHSFYTENKRNFGVVNVSQNEKGDYIVGVGNMILVSQKSQLLREIDRLKDKSIDELKLEYRSFLREAGESEKITSGLGFLKMAIDCDNNIDFNFISLEEGVDFFLVEITIEVD
ncbi:MAG: SiaB family protein kinase [Flavobacteriales bacterium]|jgi:hypothetical protein|nr:SiaB family protein kinase [Flavobacteriales bacterium]